jgi:hypothetical protein
MQKRGRASGGYPIVKQERRGEIFRGAVFDMDVTGPYP